MIHASAVKPNMTVVCMKNIELGKVESMEGTETVKLAKGTDGHTHFFPLSWVKSVDKQIHLDRSHEQAVKEWSIAIPKKP
jgi:hypothetical protein